MTYSYYPGCTLKTKGKDLDCYGRFAAEKLGVTLKEIADWQCCGGAYTMARDEIASKLSAVRTLASARDEGNDVVTLCSACHNVLKQVNNDMKVDENINLKANNYLALEKMSNVILTPMEETKKLGLNNLKFLDIRAECLPCYIPERSLDRIYLNFSTPLPKLGYATQRLTHRNFLEVYKKLLKPNGEIIQKTDNRDFFDFSVEEYKACGFTLTEINYNLHENGNPKDNIVTEYESKWVEQGLPIHKVIAKI